MSRRAGLLLPLFSIRTRRPDSSGLSATARRSWGVGEIPDLVPMARYAQRAGFKVLQMLPVCEAAHGQSSPYFARTAFALDPAYLCLDDVPDFHQAGGVAQLPESARRALDSLTTPDHEHRVAWGPVREVKRAALEMSFRSFMQREWSTRTERASDLARFGDEHAHWLDDYALFSALGEAWNGGGGHGGWDAWAPELKNRVPAALDEARTRLADRILYHRYVQWLLDGQWRQARRRVAEEGVTLMGDLPFMVAADSADVWQRALEFRLDATIGVPPDAFSADGQDWGLPVFRWDLMKQGDYEWMRERARRAAELFGLYRIDHVVGLFRTWYILADKLEKGFIPEAEPEQIAQGERLLAILKAAAGNASRGPSGHASRGPSDNPSGGPGSPNDGPDGNPSHDGDSAVIAEDLGVVPDFVRASLTRLRVPGYRVMRWEMDGPVYRDPANYPALSVATTGTHDTESLADWYDALPDWHRRAYLEIPGLAALRAQAPVRFDDRVRDAILKSAYASGSDLVLLPLQDCFGQRERVNVPGTVNQDNWSYRMPSTVEELMADDGSRERLAQLARLR